MNRSRERFRLARLAVAIGGIENVVGVLCGMTRVGLLTRGLSARDYGLYVTTLGIVASAMLTDFGLHYSLVNAVSKAKADDDENRIRRLVATGFVIYAAIAVVGIAVVGIAITFAPLSTVLRIPADQVSTARIISFIGFTGLFGIMPLRVVHSCLIGTQDQHIPSAFRIMVKLTQLGVLAALVFAGNLQLIVIAVADASVEPVMTVVFAAWAARHRPLAAIRVRLATRADVTPLFSSGFVFLVTNLAQLFSRTVPVLVISNALTPEAVPRFTVPFALFLAALSASQLLAYSLWPAYGEAAARGDWPWVERAFRLAAKGALTTAVLFAALGMWAGADVVRMWAPSVVAPSRLVFVGLAIWLLSQSFIVVSTGLLSGLSRNRLLMWTGLAEGLATSIASAVLVRSNGVEGVAIAAAGSSAVAALFLNTYAVSHATERKVSGDGTAYLRVASCGAIAIATGWIASWALGTAPAPVRVVGIGGSVSLAHIAIAWSFVLSREERARIRGWIARRFSIPAS